MDDRRRLGLAALVASAFLLMLAGLWLAADRGGTPSASTTAPAASACSPATRDDLGTVVQGQLDAFSSDDWDRALRFTTSDFRAGISASDLERLITRNYPVAATAVDSTLGECLTDGDLGQAVVTVESVTGRRQDLLYLFVREDGQWQVAGATELDTGPPSTAI